MTFKLSRCFTKISSPKAKPLALSKMDCKLWIKNMSLLLSQKLFFRPSRHITRPTSVSVLPLPSALEVVADYHAIYATASCHPPEDIVRSSCLLTKIVHTLANPTFRQAKYGC